ncbi:hypothetical protein [Nannocystis radixulma]|uniref:Uncharacterized protein n=1 Tax=Nannocystis radixulma TaxID=2995305 RepID=A0ABT5BMR6_9BACT|nr:hypothetical protein [Nannocystis radixulma]MDC0675448.1 hypothetical protein [Nannocystis radixulma]
MTSPVSTYRLQLRTGFGFRATERGGTHGYHADWMERCHRRGNASLLDVDAIVSVGHKPAGRLIGMTPRPDLAIV